MYCHTYSKSMDQPGKVAKPAYGQLNRENEYIPRPRSRLIIWSRETGSAVPFRVSMYGHTYSTSVDQPGEVDSPARGQLNSKK